MSCSGISPPDLGKLTVGKLYCSGGWLQASNTYLRYLNEYSVTSHTPTINLLPNRMLDILR